ncbi:MULTISPECIES: DEAD/DEAH box helicase [Roseomonadaceae]|uniref:DEAD/DEAH box helicase n=1 Tax=Falsiroseomonas oleicola TaxID=2801474 RepID=A0ABS6H5P3_9PROT|nr:DEAD/DEAH box helicase [Roseomonas oleicola]MBU8543779.1 DEAD/DEAH box helicase [Roseomonas oleicola]
MDPTNSSLLLHALSDTVLRRSFGEAALQAGSAYASQGRVRRMEMAANGQILAQVQGTATRPYRQSITLLPRPTGGIAFLHSCTCPVGLHCKHVAAVLVRLRAAPAQLASLQHALRLAPAPAAPAVPPEVAAWLSRLTSEATPPAPPRDQRQVLFLFDLPPMPPGQTGGQMGRLTAKPVTVQIRKDGSIGAARNLGWRGVPPRPAYIEEADAPLLRRLDNLRWSHHELGRDEEPAELLRRILATGRARWRTAEGPTLREGRPRPGDIAWQVEEDGGQRPVLTLPAGLQGFLLDGYRYLDPARGEVGPVRTELPPALLLPLLTGPPIPPDAAPHVTEALARLLPGTPPPVALDPPQPLDGPPAPLLRLIRTTLPFDPAAPRNRRPAYGKPLESEVPAALPSFRYGPLTLPPGGDMAPRTLRHDGRLYRLNRDAQAEWLALDRLVDAGLTPAGDLAPAYLPFRSKGEWLLAEDAALGGWLGFLLDQVPALQAQGWQVEIAEDFPLRLVEPADAPSATLREGSGIDWFELELGVTVDGERLDLVPLLLRMIGGGKGQALLADQPDDKPLLLPMADGRLLRLPMARLRPTLQALDELLADGAQDPEAAGIGFSRLDAPRLAAFEAASQLRFEGGEALRSLGRQLREAGGTVPPVTIPPGFQADLRPYQAEGVAWLQMLRGAGLGGILADDMGLGKTVQTLAHLAIEQAQGRLDRPALILCPTSLIPNWRREAARFAPDLRLLVLHGTARKAAFGEIAGHHLVLTSYPLLGRDIETLAAQDWRILILDEAQAIRNPKAETSQAARRLKADQVLCLSGTPLQNHLGDLWALFDLLAPGFLGSEKSFRSRYRTPVEKRGDTARQAALVQRVRPFLLRRTKAEVVRDLPPKTEIVEPVELEAAQRAIYEGIRLAMHEKVKAAIAKRGLARSGIIILDALLKLRQACCDPRLLKLPVARSARPGSAKLDRLMELLETLLEEGRRVLVFSQFTSMLALIEDRLRADAIPHLILTGDTRDRDTPVRQFQDGAVPVFLIGLKAGGVGLNLTAADTVIHYDPWWNPAVEDQATDRAHRIGQDRPVFVHRLVTLGTIEDKMETLKARKRELVAGVLGGEEGAALNWTEADIEALFAPGG